MLRCFVCSWDRRRSQLTPSVRRYLVSDWANVDNFPAMLDHETKSVQSQTGGVPFCDETPPPTHLSCRRVASSVLTGTLVVTPGNPDAVYKLQWVLTTSAKMYQSPAPHRFFPPAT